MFFYWQVYRDNPNTYDRCEVIAYCKHYKDAQVILTSNPQYKLREVKQVAIWNYQIIKEISRDSIIKLREVT